VQASGPAVERRAPTSFCGLSTFLVGKPAFLCRKFSLAHRSGPTISVLGRLLGDLRHKRINPIPERCCERRTAEMSAPLAKVERSDAAAEASADVDIVVGDGG